jgi:phage N-6-adenine-methyltransferase
MMTGEEECGAGEQTDYTPEFSQAVLALKKLGDRMADNRHLDPAKMKLVFATAETRTLAAQSMHAEGMPKREIARRLGVDEKTVRNDLAAAENSATGAEISAPKHRSTLGTGENEWYTPPEILRRVRAVLGNIDLDPASSDKAQEIVRATAYLTKADDPISRSWWGKVFMNPPYSFPAIEKFILKLVEEWEARSITEAIVLTNACTDAEWFHTIAFKSKAFCLTKGRIRFLRGSDLSPASSPLEGQAFFYLGDNEKQFTQEFGTVGVVAKLTA